MKSQAGNQTTSVVEPEVLPPVPAPESGHPTSYVACSLHPEVVYRRGGFCERCYAEDTLARVRAIDESFADVAPAAALRLKEVLDLAVDSRDPEMLRVILRPILSAVDMVQGRFRRPQEIEVRSRTQQVVVTGSPIDFMQAAREKAAIEAPKGARETVK